VLEALPGGSSLLEPVLPACLQNLYFPEERDERIFIFKSENSEEVAHPGSRDFPHGNAGPPTWLLGGVQAGNGCTTAQFVCGWGFGRLDARRRGFAIQFHAAKPNKLLSF
jgi:hypothetical protein